MPNTTQLQMELCEDAVEWCLKEKASFLRQRIQAKLAALYCELKRYKDALALTKKLLREVKKFDDKALMVEIELVESQVFYILKNIPKSKGALTAARANANAFYCPPLLQARIDLQAGILCGAEKDFKTAFSYFYEAYEGYNNANMGLTAMVCLKYMCLAKIMTSQPGKQRNRRRRDGRRDGRTNERANERRRKKRVVRSDMLLLMSTIPVCGQITCCSPIPNSIFILPFLPPTLTLRLLCVFFPRILLGSASASVHCQPSPVRPVSLSLLAADVYSIINGKAGIKYAGVELEAMRAVSDAYKNRSIQTLEEVLARYKPQLADDLIIAGHLAELRDNLLDQNLLRLLEPFSRVQLAHVAKLIALPRAVVEAKLSEMILDKKLLGILDQGSGDLILFEPSAEDVSYKHSLAAVKELDACVDRLYAKTKRLAQS